ncbi:hypothetical protein F2Q65_15495 [Thiohalocapsa marina]|uniref:Uncharacterized protein n=1 Tax=Thiohalocapsa marina TaxID=424902 RepID=A0A5M8FFI1_9GAMM|nr:hypothetical protein [Thiohalocapsa marina]KAA6183467.1 hypothetical protein F2Q65_15495 [Thiohalocapsa marina]
MIATEHRLPLPPPGAPTTGDCAGGVELELGALKLETLADSVTAYLEGAMQRRLFHTLATAAGPRT